MPSMTYWKLRRLGPRAVRVFQRRQAALPAIAAYEGTLLPKEQGFALYYDEIAHYRAPWQDDMAHGKGAVGRLLAVLRGWLPLVQRDVPSFDSSELAYEPDVPDDVLEDAARLHDIVFDHRDAAGQPLPYQQSCLAVIDRVLMEAQREWAGAEATDQRYGDLLARVRAAGEQLDLDLQAFRRTVASHVGRSDKDFQKLRAEHAQDIDEDDDLAAPGPTTPVPPAPPGVHAPRE
jgi:hypothetical protein